jgi:hypothetical protein
MPVKVELLSAYDVVGHRVLCSHECAGPQDSFVPNPVVLFQARILSYML